MNQATRAAARICAVGICLCSAWFVRSFVFPSQRAPDRADAVVVFAGGHRNVRIGRAVELMEEKVAPTLVISVGNQIWSQGTDVETLCRDGSEDFEVICVAPNPDSTIGEAAAFATIAKDRDWSDLVAVTSTNHLTRASLWLSRCFDGGVWSIAARDRTLVGVGHELLGTVHAISINRSCPAGHGGRITRG